MSAKSRVVIVFALIFMVAPLAVLAHGPRPHPRDVAVYGGTRPEYQLTFRIGEFEPDGDSDLWDENVDLYGLAPDGLDDTTVGVEFGMTVSNHFEVLFGVDYFSEDDSSYRFVDTDGVPIVLSHELRIMPVTTTFRLVPFGRYAPNGQHRRVVPYVGAGVGVYFWDYEERGDFIDPVTDIVTTGRAFADGNAFGSHVALGLEVAVTPYWSLTMEGRRSFVDDDLGSLFEGYDDLDLSGDSLTVGASFRF